MPSRFKANVAENGAVFVTCEQYVVEPFTRSVSSGTYDQEGKEIINKITEDRERVVAAHSESGRCLFNHAHDLDCADRIAEACGWKEALPARCAASVNAQPKQVTSGEL